VATNTWDFMVDLHQIRNSHVFIDKSVSVEFVSFKWVPGDHFEGPFENIYKVELYIYIIQIKVVFI